MADVKITELPAAIAVSPDDTLIIVQNGVTRRISISDAINAEIASAPSGIALDTDGVPYFDATGTTTIGFDTDGVPYLA